MFNNYKKSISEMKKKYNRIIHNIANKEKSSIDSNLINYKNRNNSNNLSSNFYITQVSSFNNNNYKFNNKKITFNKINNIKKKKMNLNSFKKQITLNNISYKI